MSRRKTSTPTYRYHKARNCAVVTIGGKDHYLGAYKSPESREKYDRLIAEWLAKGRQCSSSPEEMDSPSNGRTVNNLILEFVNHASGYYRRADGTSTTELSEYKRVLSIVRDLYGRTPAVRFGPLALKAVRAKLIEAGLCRGVINQRIDRIKRMFKWAVENELVDAATYQALATVRGLPKGRTAVRESMPVRPVPQTDVEETLKHLNRFLAAMVQVQLLTGMRPGEVCQMRGDEVDPSGSVWFYRPAVHKTAHHGHSRIIPIGPKGQAVLRPLLAEAGNGYLFDSRRASAEGRAAHTKGPTRRAGKVLSQVAAKRPMVHYRPSSYAHAIRRVCVKAGVPPWHPHQLRHNAATEIRRNFGLDMARAVLGHHSPQITELYAERDMTQAADAMAKVG